MSVTESTSNHKDLQFKSTIELLNGINQEDRTVANSVSTAIPQIERLIDAILPKMKEGGRLFYIGAGTSGRLGIVDASECPPTYGVDHNTVIGLIAGGDQAIRKAVEFAEDDDEQAWVDLSAFQINNKDCLIGIAASGRTPYVIGGVNEARKQGLVTGCITCNPKSKLARTCEFPIEVVVGPEYVTGSTRMKAGTAQKLVLNMISTSLMIKLGHVEGNQMVDMKLSNSKLVERGKRMVSETLDISEEEADDLLRKYGSVRKAVKNHNSNIS
jgi:N-acetylmuramic acid 6-phosphate etherase